MNSLHGTQARWEENCRCGLCRNAHRSYMDSQRRKGVYRVNHHARNSTEATKPRKERFQKDLQLTSELDCFTKKQFMKARGYV